MQLDEVVSLDGLLCPTLLPEIKDEYWPHIVSEDFMLNFFIDLDYLLQETASTPNKNLLCVYREPNEEPLTPNTPQAFEFLGFDLVEVGGSTSALTNCGGFPDAFANIELTKKGLIASHARAKQIQSELRHLHPDEHHANTNVWAILRANEL